ncbi:MAG: class I SAM-dependent methyltransferase [Chloroflexota bacterium]|nr:class I SAM-dependent methyltransferase [Chloroflexota bacterium]
MERWRRRALAYKAIAKVPHAEQLADLTRVFFGRLRAFDVGGRRRSVEEMARILQVAGKSVEGQRLMEIGAGWHPVLPAALHCGGAETIVMTDIVRHMRRKYVLESLNYLRDHAAEIASPLGIAVDTFQSRLAPLHPGGGRWEDIWESRGIAYKAPSDSTRTGMPAESIDMIYSNFCLSFIPVPVLEAIFDESVRLLRRGGWIAHIITTYDDYASSDPAITPLNFLRFDEREWDRIGNSPIHYQNRLRPSSYLRLAKERGLVVRYSEKVKGHFDATMLDRSVLDAAYREMSDDDLLCAQLLFVAEKP